MKKIYALLITMILLFAACQPTPESPVVVNKANGELESKIQQTAAPTPEPVPEETSRSKTCSEPSWQRIKRWK